MRYLFAFPVAVMITFAEFAALNYGSIAAVSSL